jgi:predicted nucleic acid-binding protein
VTGRLLLDNSAWVRLGHETLSRERVAEVAAALKDGRIVVCLPFMLEAGYSARDARAHAELFEELRALPCAAIDDQVQRRCLDAQAQLARTGHHRMAPVDLLTGAIAERHGLGVLHYDADYDVLVARTDLAFDSVWLAGRGTL